MASKEEYSNLAIVVMIPAWLVLITNLYYFGFPIFHKLGWEYAPITDLFISFRNSGFFETTNKLKFWALLLSGLSHILKVGKSTETKWIVIIGLITVGLASYFLPFRNANTYLLNSILGFVLTNIGLALAARKGFNKEDATGTDEVWFPQTSKLQANKYSVNIPYRFAYKQKKKKGYINVVAPFRATMICGTPGAGKSYSVFGPFIRQMLDKDYAMFLYDYKFPDLSVIAYNRWLKNMKQKKGYNTDFCVINFDDPRYSNRCNPVHPRYITEPADTTEMADLVMLNVNKSAIEKEDFFSMSAKMYLDLLLWFLKIYENGRYCTFPHVIELMSQPYEKVFEILKKFPELKSKLTAFVDALEYNAQEQLQGQIASARIPLGKFTSPSIYWTLSADDFSLQINDPKKPKILCVGNNPNRQSIYGTTLALVTARMFRQINKKHQHHSAVLLDELPTIFIKGLDNLIATARSNKVAIVLGVQDKAQLIRDYGQKESDVIFGTVGNRFSGQVKGKSAEEECKAMGKIKWKQKSVSTSESKSTTISYHDEDILPVSRIENLTQGEFFGSVADSNDQKIKKKQFFGEIMIDTKKISREEEAFNPIPQITFFGEDEIDEEFKDEIRAKEKVQEYLYNEKCQEAAHRASRNDDEMDANKILIEVDDLLNAMSRSEYEELVERIKQKMKDDKRNEIIEDNFQNIRRDVELIIEKEYSIIAAKKIIDKNRQKANKKNDAINDYKDKIGLDDEP